MPKRQTTRYAHDDATVLRCNRRASTIDAFTAAIENDVLDEAIVVTLLSPLVGKMHACLL
jgi:hypothetical protein